MIVRGSQVYLHSACSLRSICLLWLGCLMLVGCNTPTNDQAGMVQPTMAPTRMAVPTPSTPTPSAAITKKHCASMDAGSATRQSPQPSRSGSEGQDLNDTAVNVSYDVEKNTITLHSGEWVTFPAISHALNKPDAIHESTPGEWLLSANLVVEQQATLQIAAPEVQWLKLRSDDQDFISIKVLGGRLEIVGSCVTSWDSTRNTYDTSYADGRSFVLARNGARMDIRNAELSYLGYDANQSYGLAWRLSGTTGEIIDSYLSYNFYGLYSYEASDLVIRGNEVHHSVRYGIDPHTRSNRLLIENNVSHHNGKHGIILAEGCSDSIIRNNTVYSNTLHGIVIYQGSNNNLVEGNTSYDNGQQGINVNDSAHNTIRGNTVYDNTESGIGIGQDAVDNLVEGNHVYDNQEDGIFLYSGAVDTTMHENQVSHNRRHGIYVKSTGNTIGSGNQISGNTIGVYLNVDPAPEVSRQANRIYDNREADIRSDTK